MLASPAQSAAYGRPRIFCWPFPSPTPSVEPLAKAILRGAREMVRELAMSEATFAEIKKELSDEHMVDLVLTIAFYCAVVRVLATMKIDNEPYYKEVLQQYPIPGVE
jgi:hypothetical protein